MPAAFAFWVNLERPVGRLEPAAGAF